MHEGFIGNKFCYIIEMKWGKYGAVIFNTLREGKKPLMRFVKSSLGVTVR